MAQSATVTVIIATHNRPSLLDATLRMLAEQRAGEQWDVLVVDNGGTDLTTKVVREMESRLPVRLLQEPEVSKAKALNRALDNVCSKWLIFTDDDVSPRQPWLAEMIKGFGRGQHSAVCGPIVPAFPSSTPQWLRSHSYAAFAFGSFRPFIREGPLPADMVPFGANFGVSSSLVSDLRFREDLGPSQESPWRTGEDTEFLQRVRARSGSIIYMPRAIVAHNLRPDSVEWKRIFDRAFSVGRSYVLLDGSLRSAEALGPTAQSSESKIREFELGVVANFYYGQLYEFSSRGNHDSVERMLNLIASLPSPPTPQLLSNGALQCSEELSVIPHHWRQK
jgi:glycosyltransferase involved in cell wall biosynthesis